MSRIITDDSIQLKNFMTRKMELYNKNSLKKLYNHLNRIVLNDVKILSFKDDNIDRELYSLNENDVYMSDKIRNYINKHLNKVSIYNLMINKLNITIKVYYKNEDISYFVNMLIYYIRFISSLTKISLNNLEINYYLTNYKKLLNEKIILTKDQVNSGSCLIKGSQSAYINIWRKEEILKVTIHELIHAFDFSRYSDTHQLSNHYKNRYNINVTSTLSNEAYTEIWANILNCYLISQIINKNPRDSFIEMVSLERSYSIYLAQKLLYRMKGKHNIDINKNTHVLEYYIIRAEIYEEFDKFIIFCKNENKDYIKIIDDNKIITSLLDNNKLKQNNKKFNNIKKKEFYYKTIRLSINELQVF